MDNMSEIQVGDTVRIRQWDDMAEGFGISRYGSIDCAGHFTADMRKYCGSTFIVERIEPRYDSSDAWNVYGHGLDYTITTDMLELVSHEIDYDTANSDIDTFLNEFAIQEA